MSETVTELSESLFSQLQKEKLFVLGTVDAETGGPAVNAISWIYAASAKKLRFAVDSRSRIINNVKSNSSVTVTCFAQGTVNAIYGKAAIVTEALEDVPFKLTCIDIDIDAIRDAMFYGARISVEPEYEKTYDKRAAEKLDGQVFAAMKKA
jgi:hypothetical protein